MAGSDKRTNAPVEAVRPIATTFESAAFDSAFFRVFVVVIFEASLIKKPRRLEML